MQHGNEKYYSRNYSKQKEDGGIKQVYYVACGGSYGAFYPAKTFLETEATDIKVAIYNSNEFVHNTPKAFGKNSVLIVHHIKVIHQKQLQQQKWVKRQEFQLLH
jgi:fructoselysine-6-P-deglycase FrlB-like protein